MPKNLVLVALSGYLTCVKIDKLKVSLKILTIMNLDNYKCKAIAVVSRWNTKYSSFAIILMTDDIRAAKEACNAYNRIATIENTECIYSLSLEKCYFK